MASVLLGRVDHQERHVYVCTSLGERPGGKVAPFGGERLKRRNLLSSGE